MAASWTVSSWLALVRMLQVLGTLASALLNGFLLVYIHVNKLGQTQAMFVLEILTCVVLLYTTITLLAQHTGNRRRRPSTSSVATFVVGDVIFTGITIAVLTILSRTGVPSNCAGLTRSNFEKGDTPNHPPRGYDTIRFGDGSPGDRGVLDKYCALERGYYFISVAIIFSYMITVTLAILRICEGLYTKNSVVNEQLATASKLYALESLDPYNSHRLSTATGEPSTASSPVVRQEGVPPTSRPMPPPRPQLPQLLPTQEQRQQQQQQQQRRGSVLPVSPLTPLPTASEGIEGESLGFWGDRNRAGEEDSAEAAVITDGFRPAPYQPGVPPLPPYSPGSSSRFLMEGHGAEHNDMRLSEYVKGQTRAQDMKDSGAS